MTYVVFLILGVAGLGYGLAELHKARDSEDWPMREARVLESRIRENRGGKRTTYSPVVRYEYRHEGAVYEGKRIMFSGLELTSSREDVAQFLAPFARGSQITVRVSPRNPRVSVVEPGVDRRLKLMLFIVSYVAFVGLGGLLDWWK